jgi:hypothetical protein
VRPLDRLDEKIESAVGGFPNSGVPRVRQRAGLPAAHAGDVILVQAEVLLLSPRFHLVATKPLITNERPDNVIVLHDGNVQHNDRTWTRGSARKHVVVDTRKMLALPTSAARDLQRQVSVDAFNRQQSSDCGGNAEAGFRSSVMPLRGTEFALEGNKSGAVSPRQPAKVTPSLNERFSQSADSKREAKKKRRPTKSKAGVQSHVIEKPRKVQKEKKPRRGKDGTPRSERKGRKRQQKEAKTTKSTAELDMEIERYMQENSAVTPS